MENTKVAGLLEGASKLSAFSSETLMSAVVPAPTPLPKLTGLASLLKGYKGWVIGSGSGPTELSW